MQKLIKINTDHYVIVDDSEIKEGDYVLSKLNEIIVFGRNYTPSFYKKITHSTQPLEEVRFLLRNEGKAYFNKIQELSLQEVKELIGEMDVEKKAKKYLDEHHNNEDIAHPELYDEYNSFIKGYNQALEDNKEKKYTEEDILNMLYDYDNVDWNKREHKQSVIMMREWLSEKLQSLQSKTEWEVEFIDGKLKLK